MHDWLVCRVQLLQKLAVAAAATATAPTIAAATAHITTRLWTEKSTDVAFHIQLYILRIQNLPRAVYPINGLIHIFHWN